MTNQPDSLGSPVKTGDLLGDRDYNLFVMTHQTSRLIGQVRENELSKYDISNIESGVLFAIQAIEQTRGPAQPGEIARWLLRRPHTITQLVGRMEKKGLVKKVNLVGQRNSKRIVLTERGKQVSEGSLERHSIHRIMSVLSEEERRQLWSCLHKLSNRAVKELGMKYDGPFPRRFGRR